MVCVIYEGGQEVDRIVASEEFARQYCADNGYTYEVEPEPEPERPAGAEHSAEDDVNAMLVDHEVRLTMLELFGEEV